MPCYCMFRQGNDMWKSSYHRERTKTWWPFSAALLDPRWPFLVSVLTPNTTSGSVIRSLQELIQSHFCFGINSPIKQSHPFISNSRKKRRKRYKIFQWKSWPYQERSAWLVWNGWLLEWPGTHTQRHLEDQLSISSGDAPQTNGPPQPSSVGNLWSTKYKEGCKYIIGMCRWLNQSFTNKGKPGKEIPK